MADEPAPTTRPGLAQVLGQGRDLWQKLSRRRRTALIATVLAVLGGVLFLSLRPTTAAWQPLLARVTPEDGVELTAALDGRGIPYRFAADGQTVEVPTERLAEARVVATAAGLPHAGAGFELFDHASLGESSFAEQVNYRRALSGELARSITTLAQVEGARVHVALGHRSVLKDADQPPSASVALRLHAGQHLSADEVHGVKELVAASVEGLSPDAVVVVDDHGNLLGGDDKSQTDRAEIEQATAARVRGMLERVVGAGHVVVVATAEIDTSKVQQTEDLFDQGKSALRSESRTVEGTGATATTGGVAGVQGNLPGAPAAGAGPGAPGNGRLSETKNYEVSHVVRQTTGPDAKIQRLHLAILVDEPVDAKGKVQPRSADQMAELTALAREAAGLDDSRGDKLEIRAARFAPDEMVAAPAAPPPPAAAPLPWVWLAAGGGALLLVLGALVVLLTRKRGGGARRGLTLPARVGEVARIYDLDSGDDAMPALAARPVHDRVLDSIRGDTPRAARVLSSWLAEPARGAKS